MATRTDNFDRANSTSLGANWTEDDSDWLINSNAVYMDSVPGNSGSNYGKLRWSGAAMDSADYSVECAIRVPDNTHGIGPAARLTVGSTITYYAFIAFGGDTAYLLYINGGAENVLATASGVSIATNTTYTLRIEVEGNQIRGYVNNVLRASATHSALTSGPPGIGAYGGFDTASNADSWIAIDLASGAVINSTFAGAGSIALAAPTARRTLRKVSQNNADGILSASQVRKVAGAAFIGSGGVSMASVELYGYLLSLGAFQANLAASTPILLKTVSESASAGGDLALADSELLRVLRKSARSDSDFTLAESELLRVIAASAIADSDFTLAEPELLRLIAASAGADSDLALAVAVIDVSGEILATAIMSAAITAGNGALRKIADASFIGSGGVSMASAGLYGYLLSLGAFQANLAPSTPILLKTVSGSAIVGSDLALADSELLRVIAASAIADSDLALADSELLRVIAASAIADSNLALADSELLRVIAANAIAGSDLALAVAILRSNLTAENSFSALASLAASNSALSRIVTLPFIGSGGVSMASVGLYAYLLSLGAFQANLAPSTPILLKTVSGSAIVGSDLALADSPLRLILSGVAGFDQNINMGDISLRIAIAAMHGAAGDFALPIAAMRKGILASSANDVSLLLAQGDLRLLGTLYAVAAMTGMLDLATASVLARGLTGKLNVSAVNRGAQVNTRERTIRMEIN